MRRIALLIVTVLAGLVASSPAAASDPPTYAYYYIWFSAELVEPREDRLPQARSLLQR